MAKVKSAGLRNYVGRLGGSVYYMNKGQNIGRELAPEVSNPRTPAQMRQRMKWANLVNIYKANRSWMGHLSFETKKQTWSDYNAFMSANIGTNPVYLTKGAAENGDAILAPYTMTKGSLKTISYDYAANLEGVETDILLSEDPTSVTIGEFSANLILLNPEWQQGDQLSVILMYKGVAPYPIVDAIELIIDVNDTRYFSDLSARFASLDEIFALAEPGVLAVHMGEGVSYGNQAVCIVHSRTISGRTAVSTQAFVLNVTAQITFQQMGTDEQFQYAAASYGLGSDYFLSTDDSTQGGGGGETDLIRSFTGKYQPDNTGEEAYFTITNDASNTFMASDSLAISDKTICTLVGRSTLQNTDYLLSFTPTGDSEIVIGTTSPAADVKTLVFDCARTDALQIERTAGVFKLYLGDEPVGTPVQTWVVS